MCVEARSNHAGSELTLGWCDGPQEQDWEMKGTGEMVSVGTSLCVTMQDGASKGATVKVGRERTGMMPCERGRESQSESLPKVGMAAATKQGRMADQSVFNAQETTRTMHGDSFSDGSYSSAGR